MHSPLTQKLLEESREEIYRYSETPFRLSSGKESHHYFNCRKITLIPSRLALMAKAIRDELLPGEKVEAPAAVGGLTMGADPIAFALSLAYQETGRTVYPLIVRKEAKGHGMGRRIEGEAESVSEVLLLDDVVTTAGSSIQAARAFREAGIAVHTAVVVVDREEGGREALAAEGIRLVSLFKKSDFSE